MTGVLVYSERDDLAYDLLSWAAQHDDTLGTVCAVVLGKDAEIRAEAYRQYGAERLFILDDPAILGLQDDAIAPVLQHAVEQSDASIILISATRRGRSLAPRLAQELGAGCVDNVIQLRIENVDLIAERYSLGGNTLSQELVKTPRAVFVVMPGTVEKASPTDEKGEIIRLSPSVIPSRVSVIERLAKTPSAANIGESDKLVCVGRGLAQQEDLAVIEDLAEALGGEMACTRPLSYEYGWVSENRMIGISGEVCSPDLMISVGVSGQVQHTVGIMGSKIIVAVNKDPNAPIFNVADYGIVGDMYEVIPAISEALKARGRK